MGEKAVIGCNRVIFSTCKFLVYFAVADGIASLAGETTFIRNSTLSKHIISVLPTVAGGIGFVIGSSSSLPVVERDEI